MATDFFTFTIKLHFYLINYIYFVLKIWIRGSDSGIAKEHEDRDQVMVHAKLWNKKTTCRLIYA